MPSFTLPAFLQQEALRISPLRPELFAAAQDHWDNRTKPLGSLGRLEEMGARLYCIQEGKMPISSRPARMYTLAADHGVVEEGVASMSSDITVQMVMNFVQNGAGINTLCQSSDVELLVVDMGIAGNLPENRMVLDRKIASGTANFSKGPAMTKEECHKALKIGIDLAKDAASEGIRVVGLGEMGIGNTTSSSALFCGLLGFTPEEVTGIGAGAPPKGVAHKAAVIQKALYANKDALSSKDPLKILAAFGGYEIAGLAGLIIGAAACKIAVMVDGFIATAAYTAAWKLVPGVREYCFFSHGSAELGHQKVLEKLGEIPYLNLGLRLGEGSGAALGIFLLHAATDAFTKMAGFYETGVEKPF